MLWKQGQEDQLQPQQATPAQAPAPVTLLQPAAPQQVVPAQPQALLPGDQLQVPQAAPLPEQSQLAQDALDPTEPLKLPEPCEQVPADQVEHADPIPHTATEAVLDREQPAPVAVSAPVKAGAASEAQQPTREPALPQPL